MPGDFQLVAGTHATLVPVGKKNGQDVAFPIGTIFQWEVDNADAGILNDPSSPSPDLLGGIPTSTDKPMTVTCTVTENGFTHTKVHTVDVIPGAVVDALDDIDFVLSPSAPTPTP